MNNNHVTHRDKNENLCKFIVLALIRLTVVINQVQCDALFGYSIELPDNLLRLKITALG